MPQERKLIGELNGKWALLFKISLVLTPLFISLIVTWGAWTTSKVYAHDVALTRLESWKDIGPRFTAVDAQALELRVKEQVAEINERKFQALMAKLDELTMAINDLKVQMAKRGGQP